jgi:transposase InsO family protein
MRAVYLASQLAVSDDAGVALDFCLIFGDVAAPVPLWATDGTAPAVPSVYLSTILDDYSRYIIAWKLCTTMRADDVTETLELALVASGAQRRANSSSSSSRPTSSVSPLACIASKRLSTEAGRSAVQAHTGPAIPSASDEESVRSIFAKSGLNVMGR